MFPVLFTIGPFFGRGPFPFYTYGCLLGIALFCAYELGQRRAAREGIPERKLAWFAAAVMVGGYFGSHLHALATDPTGAEMGLISGQGFTFYGAALSGIIVAVPACRILGLAFLKMCDVGAPCLALAAGIGRIGCFCWGCCYGIQVPEGSPIGVHFPQGSPAWEFQVKQGLIAASAPRSLPVVPIMLVEVVYELALAAFLVWAIKPKRQGTVLLVWVLAYGPLRILCEHFRGDPERGTSLGLSTSTTIGIATTVAAALLLLVPRLRDLRPLREKP